MAVYAACIQLTPIMHQHKCGSAHPHSRRQMITRPLPRDPHNPAQQYSHQNKARVGRTRAGQAARAPREQLGPPRGRSMHPARTTAESRRCKASENTVDSNESQNLHQPRGGWPLTKEQRGTTAMTATALRVTANTLGHPVVSKVRNLSSPLLWS
jgi:hypothetical protein